MLCQTYVNSLPSGITTGGNKKRRVDVLMENGEICETDIPQDPENVGERGVTVIEDHTIVICGGMKTNGHGMFFNLFRHRNLQNIRI